MKYREMAEPERIKKLPHYKGLPITFTTFVHENGVPNFKATNDNVWVSKRDGLCSICGEKLDYWIAFMVDEREAESRIVFENPNHEECLRYAFNICPWLFWSNARYTDESLINLGEGIDAVSSHPNREVSNTRPPKLGIYITNRYDNIIKKERNKTFRVVKLGKAKRLEWIEGRDK